MGGTYSKALPVEESSQDAALFVGPMDFVLDSQPLTELGIRAVLTVLPTVPQGLYGALQTQNIDVATDHMHYPLEDMQEMFISLFSGRQVWLALDFIHRKRLQGKSVLVHCERGLTRSPTVVIAYIMKYGFNLHHRVPVSLDASLKHVLAVRGQYVDVALFMRDLQRLEKTSEAEEGITHSASAPSVLEHCSSGLCPSTPIPYDLGLVVPGTPGTPSTSPFPHSRRSAYGRPATAEAPLTLRQKETVRSSRDEERLPPVQIAGRPGCVTGDSPTLVPNRAQAPLLLQPLQKRNKKAGQASPKNRPAPLTGLGSTTNSSGIGCGVQQPQPIATPIAMPVSPPSPAPSTFTSYGPLSSSTAPPSALTYTPVALGPPLSSGSLFTPGATMYPTSPASLASPYIPPC